jgi:hypothetical protein
MVLPVTRGEVYRTAGRQIGRVVNLVYQPHV